MNIGIIVHSATGNTLSVAEKLKNNLTAKGYAATLERVTAVSDDPRANGGNQLKDAPSIDPYDVLIFGAPVWGFSPSAVMKEYLQQLPSLCGKKVGCYVTLQFLAGKRAVRQMEEACKAKDAVVYKTGMVKWASKKKEDQIANLIEQMGEL